MAFELVPSGPDRNAVIKHWTTVFNHLVHYMINDSDGAQKAEVFWALERIRRAIHVAYLDHKKTTTMDLEGSLDSVFGAIRNLIQHVWADNAVERKVVEVAADELRGLVTRKRDR